MMIGKKVLFNLYSSATTKPQQYIGIVQDKYRAIDSSGHIIDKYLISISEVLSDEGEEPLEKGSVTTLQPSSIAKIIS